MWFQLTRPVFSLKAIPANAQRVLKIDPRTLETTFIGPNYEGGQKWYGGLLAANGSIYGIPQNASGIIKINPTTQEVSIIGLGTLPEGEWKWHGGITTTDQKLIYGFPNNANQVLKLDTETDTIELIGDDLAKLDQAIVVAKKVLSVRIDFLNGIHQDILSINQTS